MVLEAPDARSLASFYAALLEWPVREDGDGWTVLAGPDGRSSLAFQTSAQYAAPVWPTAPGAQQMMAHLDVEVDDLATAVEHALELGATLPDFQPQEHVRVLLDPVGHPFCLYVDA